MAKAVNLAPSKIILMKTKTPWKSPILSHPAFSRSAKTTCTTISLFGIVIFGAMTTPITQAASNSWATTASGNWNDPANWTGGVIVPGNTSSGATATTDVATFSTSGAKTISLDAGRTIFGLTFASGAGNMDIGTAGNTLFLSSGGAIQSNSGASYQNIFTKLSIVGADATYSITNNGNNQIQTYGSISGATAGATVLTLNGSSTSTFNRINGNILNGSSTSLAVVKSGNGTWSLRASNSFSGGLTLNAGTLIHGHANAFGTGTFTINGGAIDGTGLVNTQNNAQSWNGNFAFVGSNTLDLGTGAVTMSATRTVTTTASTLTVGGAIGDSGSGFGLTKAGAGTLVLGGASTYTGATLVNAGTLIVNGSLASGSAVTVATTLAGSGTIGGATTLNAGSKLSAGSASAATLTFSNSLNLSAAANNTGAFVFELGTSFDKIDAGSLIIGTDLISAADFSFSTLTGFGESQSYTLFQSSGVTGSFTSFAVTNIGGSGIDGNVALVGNNIVLTTVPEPSTCAALFLGLSGLLATCRRKRRLA